MNDLVIDANCCLLVFDRWCVSLLVEEKGNGDVAS